MVDITNFVVNPITLIAMIVFAVQFIKDLGVKGNWLKVVSLVIAGIFAFAFKARELWPVYAEFIDIGFFVVLLGIGAPGGYSWVKQTVGELKQA